MTGPLAGIRVVEITNVVAGPAAGALLADQGAEVIKVEPPAGDIIRRAAENGLPAMFISCNRGKHSLALDLKQPPAQDIMWQLLATADVFLHNLRPGVMERLGFGPSVVRDRFPRLVYAAISGFGETGPYSARRVYDPLVQAVSGFADIQADGEAARPRMIRTVIADKTTAACTAQAITAALFHRERSGLGQDVRISMLDAMVSLLWPEGMSPFTIVADGGRLPPSSHDRIFETRDGYITAGSVSDREWAGLCAALDRPDWLRDPMFATQADRNRNKDRRYAMMAEVFLGRSSAEWIERLDENDVPCAPVLRRSEMLEDPQVRASSIVHELDQPGVGPIRQARPAARFGTTPAHDPRPAPRIGEHSGQILAALGYTDTEIRELASEGVVFGC